MRLNLSLQSRGVGVKGSPRPANWGLQPLPKRSAQFTVRSRSPTRSGDESDGIGSFESLPSQYPPPPNLPPSFEAAEPSTPPPSPVSDAGVRQGDWGAPDGAALEPVTSISRFAEVSSVSPEITSITDSTPETLSSSEDGASKQGSAIVSSGNGNGHSPAALNIEEPASWGPASHSAVEPPTPPPSPVGTASFASTSSSVGTAGFASTSIVDDGAPVKAQNSGHTSSSHSDEDRKRQRKLNALKAQLLAAVASLDRGLAANVQEAKDIQELVQKLEEAAGDVLLTWQPTPGTLGPSTLDVFEGTWRLIYSSGFNTGSLGGRRPGPPAALVPVTLGQVYQRINSQTGKLDNMVEFLFNGLPQLPFSPPSESSPAVRLTLRHDYEVQGSNTVQVVFEETFAELLGNSMLASLPQVGLPQLPEFLKPPRDLRAAKFEVSFLDPVMRITRGDRGELRIFLKDIGMDPPPVEDYDD